ncbi:ankyrin [Melanomma pulvis-pyrius CBS 109.77]|uniref:Ankyrin n=1 Tax=Melanomma pulvis-pyrius CBS 109.77 TaxID=1314802 RepID=A0A6A6X765_9PLEO|nr:ankyrin [Melanomma pulvis-pyrius CBS 109.77]
MDPLSVTASIIAILQLTVKVGESLSDAKDASTDRSQFTTDISNLSKLLVDLLSRVDESSDDPWHANTRQLGGKDGLIYQYRVALEQLKDKISAGHGIKKMTKTLLWKYIKDDAEHILSRIERLKSLVQIALEMDHFTLSQAIDSRVSSLQDDNKIMKVGVDAIQQDQDRQRHRLIMDWLSSNDFPAQHSDFIARRQADTGLWFLGSPEFTEWVSGSSKTLFCPGIPGAGKTMMAAIAVDHLHNAVQTPDVGIAYLYCNYKRQAEQTTANMLAAILKQLVQDRPSIAQPLSNLYDLHQVRRTRLSLMETLTALQSVLANYSKVYVVIDALDECPERDGTRSQLLRHCRNLQGQTDLRLMATSRHISDIVEEFKDMPQVEVRASNADVKRYVVGRIDELPKFVRRDGDLQELIQNKIVEMVDGMFLLARLHVDSLVDKRTKTKVISALNNLSKGSGALDDAYSEAIVRIDGQLQDDRILAKKVLSWISYAQRPLTTGELCQALAVESGDEELDLDNILDVEAILSVCAGLVTVDEESQVIGLVHYTTQDYLEGVREKWNPDAQYDIASTCLTYLCFKPFRTGSCPSDAEFESRLNEHKFLDYSARYWQQHVATVQEETSGLAMSLLQESNLVVCVVQTRLTKYGSARYSQLFSKQMTGLHLAASFGLLHLSKELLSWAEKERVILADSKNSRGETPLMLAAKNGHKDIVELLLGTDGVGVDAKSEVGWTPLMLAAFWGHKDTDLHR